MRRAWLLPVAVGLGLADGLPTDDALHPITTRNGTLIAPILVSRAPVTLRYLHLLDSRECAMVRRHLLDAVVYFNDTAADGSSRDGSRVLPVGHENRPRYRMQNYMQLSLYFKRPPPVMREMVKRIGHLLNVHPNNVEAIYHLYAPGAQPANIHLDNFNRYLYPHRFASASVFFDDYGDGGTVFPLLVPAGELAPNSSVAAETEEVLRWHRQILATRMEPDPRVDSFAGRRVDADELDAFRLRTFREAVERCKRVGSALDPVSPAKGAAYVWRNYLPNGEDDVRAIHGGCGSTDSFKMIGTLFFRDGPGPFQEHQSFWDPLEAMPEAFDEERRKLEMHQLNAMRLLYLEEFYTQQRHVAFELAGERAARWLARRQLRHWHSLVREQTHEDIERGVEDMKQKHNGTELRWFKHTTAESLF